MIRSSIYLLGGLMLLVTCQAQAYVGPGAALTLIGVLFGWVAAVATAVGMILLWPFYKIYQWWCNKRAVKQQTDSEQQDHHET